MSTKKRRKKAPKRRYVSSLDGLRALCALAVVGYHMRLPWCSGGLLGVTVLFALSGYLITAGLLREFVSARGHISIGSFLTRRFWRLMPTVVVFIAVTGAVCAIFNHLLFTKMRPDILPALFMIINWTKIFANESYFAAAGAPSPLTHFWSLAIEAQFYLVWPPILYLLMRRKVSRKHIRIGLVVLTILSAVLMAMLYVPGADPTRSYYGTDTRAMSLLLGAWLAVAWPFSRMSRTSVKRLKGARRIVALVVGPLCLVGLVAMMIFTEGYSSFYYRGGILLCSLLSIGAIACLIPSGSIVSRIFAFKPLEWIGKRSFAIYLWHFPILELLNPLNATDGIPWWKLLLELALILVVSDLSYRFVEQPFRHGVMALVKSNGSTGKKGKRGRKRSKEKSLLRKPSFVVPCAITLVGVVITVIGLIAVEPVTAGGIKADEKRVMRASLKKPLQDGVYDVVLVGDSVALGANEQLNKAFPHGLIDTAGSRQAEEALAALESYVSSGVVGNDVVWSIGTNGILSQSIMDKLLDTVGPDRKLWMVNLRTPNDKDVDNNALIDKTVSEHDNVNLVDWLSASQGHDDWFSEDGIHLTWDGRDAYAKLIVDTMGYELPDESNTTYNVTLLGDIVALDAADQLAEAFPKGLVDTADGRKLTDIVRLYEGYRDSNVVGPCVVLCVSDEDTLSEGDMESLLNAIGSDKSVWVVNTRSSNPWVDKNNELLSSLANKRDNVNLIDWHKASEGHNDWFGEDGRSLTTQGAQAYTSLIKDSVVIPETDSKSSEEGSDKESGAKKEDESQLSDTSQSQGTQSTDLSSGSGSSSSDSASSSGSASSSSSSSAKSSSSSSEGGSSNSGGSKTDSSYGSSTGASYGSEAA
ncbi:MAG: acyltransferase [Atopobiaceae bacterium]|nr:acyltransferase [Atopobiaceae bacterium]